MGQVEDPSQALVDAEELRRRDAYLASQRRGAQAVRGRALLLAGSRTARQALQRRHDPVRHLTDPDSTNGAR